MRNKKIILILTLYILVIPTSLSKEKFSNDKKSQTEKEVEFVDFSSVRNLLEKDDLEKSATDKKEKIKKVKTAREKRSINRFNVPNEDNIWSFISEYWLVKNAPVLKWDFRKPDYGISESFKMFLEKLGFYDKNFKIVFVDTPNISHFVLPSDSDEKIFVLSLPFIRALDLSKFEISILLFENYLRSEMKHFINKVKTKAMTKIIGSNFYKAKFNKKGIDDVLKVYDDVIFIKGFSIQQQFDVSKKIEGYLKTDLRLWNAYLKMLRKIDQLVKNNILYSKYIKIYPSPELQIDWLSPKKKRI